MATASKTFKPPKTLGACADLLYKLKAERAIAQKVVDKFEADEKALKEHIINTLPKSETTGVAGKVCRVTVVTKEVPQIKDLAKFTAYIKKTGDFDLMQRRLSVEAVNARLDAGKKIPGIEIFNAVSVSVNKV